MACCKVNFLLVHKTWELCPIKHVQVYLRCTYQDFIKGRGINSGSLVWCIYALPLEFATVCHSIGK